MYWVIAGTMMARQRIWTSSRTGATTGACTGLILDPELVPLVGRPTRPFQGWRYLDPDARHPTCRQWACSGLEALPAALRHELRALCLL